MIENFLNSIFEMDDIFNAVQRNDLQNAKLLLDTGINPNIINYGLWPLWIYAKSIEMFQLLHTYQADFNQLNVHKQNALINAIGKNQIDILNFLLSLKIFDLNISIEDRPLLFYFVDSDPDANVNIFKSLVENGADINIRDSKDNTLLHRTRNCDIFEYLLNCGLDPNHRNNKGKTIRDKMLENLKRINNQSSYYYNICKKLLQLIDDYDLLLIKEPEI